MNAQRQRERDIAAWLARILDPGSPQAVAAAAAFLLTFYVGLALAYVGLAATRVPADGSVDAQAWAIGLAPLFLLYGVANLIYQRHVPEEPPPASQKKGS